MEGKVKKIKTKFLFYENEPHFNIFSLYTFSSYFRTWSESFDDELEIAFGLYSDIMNPSEIRLLRANSQFSTMQDMQNRNKRMLLRELEDQTLFSETG